MQTLEKNKRLAYYTGGLMLIFVFYGPYLFSTFLGIYDWSKDFFYFSFYRYQLVNFGSVISSATLLVPFQIANYPIFIKAVSFIANPEAPLFSPLLAVSGIFSLPIFIKFYIFLHLVLALVGVDLLSKTLDLKVQAKFLVFSLFYLHPWLIQHLLIGYSPWITICYIPFILNALFKKDLDRTTAIVGSVFGALIIYEGGTHLFNWFFMALSLFAFLKLLLNREHWFFKRFLYISLLVVTLAAPRLLIGFEIYKNWVRVPYEGFKNVSTLLQVSTDGLTNIFDIENISKYKVPGLYDSSFYIGYFYYGLLVFVLALFFYRIIKNRQSLFKDDSFILLICVAVFTSLSLNSMWTHFAKRMPFLTAEIYPTRFIVIAVFIASVFILKEITLLLSNNKHAGFYLTLLFICLTTVFYTRQQTLFKFLKEQSSVVLITTQALDGQGYTYKGAVEQFAKETKKLNPTQDIDVKTTRQGIQVTNRNSSTKTLLPGASHLTDNNTVSGRIVGSDRVVAISGKNFGFWKYLVICTFVYTLLLKWIKERPGSN